MIDGLLVSENVVKPVVGMTEISALSDLRMKTGGALELLKFLTLVGWTDWTGVYRCLTGSKSTAGSAWRRRRARRACWCRSSFKRG